MIQLATKTGDQLQKFGASDEDRIRRAYELYFTRWPNDTEMNDALHFLSQFQQKHSKRAAWAAFAQAMFASAEFAHR